MGKADLHTHTNYSDGALSPAELVARAREAGLNAIAITDHDTVDGVKEGQEAGRRLGLEVIPGVEINTDVPGAEVHMLGYFLDVDSEPLCRVLVDLREGRLHRAERMVDQLRQVGVPVQMDRVLEYAGGQGAVGRPHVAQAIIEAGYAESVSEAFDKYLGTGRPGYVPRAKFTPEQAIVVIREAGGVPVLAHPAHCDCEDSLRDWVRLGLRGIEVDHTDHADEQARHFRRLCRDYGLIGTVGSDYHGLPGSRAMLGGRVCGLDTVERLRAEAERIRVGA